MQRTMGKRAEKERAREKGVERGDLLKRGKKCESDE